jgi:hypothetical protein
MNEHEPPIAGEGRQPSTDDPREERLQALYTAAYLPLDPSEALEQRVARITAQSNAESARSRGGWPLPIAWAPGLLGMQARSPRLQPTLSLGAAGVGSFVVTLLAALLLSSASTRNTDRPLAKPSVVRQESPELQARRAVWLSDPAPSLLPFPLTQPQKEPIPPRPPRALPWRRSQRHGSSPTG